MVTLTYYLQNVHFGPLAVIQQYASRITWIALSFAIIGMMVPTYQSGLIIMSDLTNEQRNEIATLIMDVYGPRLSCDELSEVIGLILENIAGFETADPQLLMQVINEIRSN